jgi:hypothetical protein
LLAAISFLAGGARAAIIITAPVIDLPYSASARTGSFEIYVQSSEVNAPLIGSHNVELQLPSSPSGVTFLSPPGPTTGTTPSDHPYLFTGQAPTELVVNAGRTVEGTDFAEGTPPALADGAGLLLVNYQIAAGASGSFPLTFVSYAPPSHPLGTGLFDGSSNQLTATLQNGSINIAPPVPEPATWILAAAACVGWLARASWGRHSCLPIR